MGQTVLFTSRILPRRSWLFCLRLAFYLVGVGHGPSTSHHDQLANTTRPVDLDAESIMLTPTSPADVIIITLKDKVKSMMKTLLRRCRRQIVRQFADPASQQTRLRPHQRTVRHFCDNPKGTCTRVHPVCNILPPGTSFFNGHDSIKRPEMGAV